MPQQGAPADFAGRVFPNPKHITPVLDTEIVPSPMRLPKGTKAIAEPYRPKGKEAAKTSIDKAPLDNTISPAKIRSFKKGTRRVPKTGVYKLHKNEAVLNPKQAARMRRAHAAMGSGKKK